MTAVRMAVQMADLLVPPKAELKADSKVNSMVVRKAYSMDASLVHSKVMTLVQMRAELWVVH
jgi:hypothetical protein